MKIVHIASGDLWAGAEVQIWTLLSELVKSHEVYAILLNDGRLADELKKSGVIVEVIPESTISFVNLIRQVAFLLKQWDVDVVHTHRQKENIIGSIANVLSVKAKCFRTVHGSPEFALSWKQRLQRKVEHTCTRFFQHGVVAVSTVLQTHLVREFGAGKVFLIHNGIDSKQVVSRASPGKVNLENASYHVGFVGRLVDVKRLDLVVESMAMVVNSSNRPCHLHIFGDGPLKPQLELDIKNASLSENVTLYGHRNDVQSYIAALDLLLMPSDHEGLPMTALESIVLGTPIVAHAVGGLVPLLNACNLKAGLVHDHSAKGYAKVIKAFMDDAPTPCLAKEYENEQTARRVLTMYQEAK